MSCNIDAPLDTAKSLLDSKLASYKTKLQDLRNLNPEDYKVNAETYLQDRANGLVTTGRQAFEQQKTALINEVNGTIQEYITAINDYTNVGAVLDKLTMTAIEEVADLFNSVFGNVPDLGPLASLISAIKDKQCI